MRGGRFTFLVSVSMLATLSQLVIAQEKSVTSAADDLRPAQLAWGSHPAKRCPELHQSTAEEGAVAVVKFMVGPPGAPSQASIRSSPGSAGFDAAAVGCVAKLHWFDKAALELSAAAHYRPATAASGKPAAGCFRFKVGIEAK